MAKGLDGKFINYGIRQDDLILINTLCEKHQVDFEWLKEDILRISDSEAFRLRCCFPSVTERRFFFNSKSKFLSNSSIIQKISVTLSLVIIVINFVTICLSDLRIQNNSVITNF